MRQARVDLTGVSKRYGAHEAVREVDLQLPAGECVALVGHNGAGKTTLMKLMLGLIRPTAGRVRVLGEDPVASGAHLRRRIGFLPENVAFTNSLTGRELLGFYARLKREPVRKSMLLLDRVGLADAANRRVGTYSKGMRQRLGLAQALLGAPQVLLLDEPTTGLDPALRQSFYDIIQELRDGGATVLLSSHALTELAERADRMVIMHRGRLLANGTVGELRRLADLPVRLRLAVNAGWTEAMASRLAEMARVTGGGGPVVEATCPEHDKMAVLRRVAGLGAAVEDIDMLPPSLDELYAHFLQERGRTE